MADKKKLNDMLDSLIDKNEDQAEVQFHSYLEDKMKEVLSPEDAAKADVDVETDVKVDDESVTKD